MKRIGPGWLAGATLALLTTCLLPAESLAQGAPSARTGGVATSPAPELEKLVAPVALYPDDLLALVLPAATTPIDVIKGQRFLEQRKARPDLKPDPKLAEPVRNLLNYQDVVRKMADEIDWTQALGEAVATRPRDIMAAVQSFRRKVQAAGNLRTDDKQLVVVEKDVIKIVQANPQVIYVPQYQPALVMAVQPAPPVTYYATPYPVYYYPYPPGAAAATGLVVGAATAFAFNWTSYGIVHGYDVHDLQQERLDYARESREDWQSHQREQQGSRQESAGARQTQRQDATAQRQTQRQEAIGNAGAGGSRPPLGTGSAPFSGGGPRLRRP